MCLRGEAFTIQFVSLPQIDVFVVPPEVLHGRPVHNFTGRSYRETVKSIVVSAVFEFLPDATADFDLHIRSYSYVSPIEKGMKISSHEKSIIDSMRSLRRIRLYMGRVQCGKRAFVGQGASAIIRISYEYAE